MVSECAREGTRPVVSSGARRDGEAGRSGGLQERGAGGAARKPHREDGLSYSFPVALRRLQTLKLLAWIWACSCPSHL